MNRIEPVKVFSVGMRTACLSVGPAIVLSVGVAAASLLSVDDEVKLGRQAQSEIRRTVPQVADGAVADYVTRIGRRLAASAPGPRYPYSFSVADYKEINAFALPGGPVWVHRGAIQGAQNEAQFAGVLAHEIAHVARRHTADRITQHIIANGLLGLLGAMLGNDAGGARTAQLGARILAGGYMLKFSRDDERDADRVGARIMSSAGWDPHAMIDFMEMLRRQQGHDAGSVEVFMSSHPGAAERATLLRAQLRGSTGGRRDSAEFQHIRKRLRSMPPARRMPVR